MSKVPQDPTKFGYRADAKVVLTGHEFTVLQHLAQKAIGNGVKETFLQTYEWVNVETGDTVEQPAQKQIKEGKVTRVPSRAKTLQNKQISYESNLYPEIFDGNEVIFRIHMRNIEADTAIGVDILQAEFQAAQEAESQKGQMTVVEDGEVALDPSSQKASQDVENETPDQPKTESVE